MSLPPDSPEVSVEMPSQNQPTMQIDFEKDRFPFSLVWTPIPVLTWFFPFIGHLGEWILIYVVHERKTVTYKSKLLIKN